MQTGRTDGRGGRRRGDGQRSRPRRRQAATVTVTGDDGNPAGAHARPPPTIRNKDVNVRRRPRSATRPSSASRSPRPTACRSVKRPQLLLDAGQPLDARTPTRGNGTYTVTGDRVQRHGVHRACCARRPTSTWCSAGVAIAPPAGACPRFVRRGISTPNTLRSSALTGNPGAYGTTSSTRRRHDRPRRRDQRSPSATAIVSSTTGQIPLQRHRTRDRTSWSRAQRRPVRLPVEPRAVTIRAQAPFDLSSRSCPGPDRPRATACAATSGRRASSGRVKLAIKPRRGRRWRSLGVGQDPARTAGSRSASWCAGSGSTACATRSRAARWCRRAR